jgi:hypothetical protein
VLQLKALSRSTSFTQPILLLDTPPTFRKDNQQNISTKKNTALYYFESKIKEPEATESLDVWWIVKWINKKLFRYDKCDYLSSRIQEHNGTANPKILIVDRGDSASFHKSNCAERIALLGEYIQRDRQTGRDDNVSIHLKTIHSFQSELKWDHRICT